MEEIGAPQYTASAPTSQPAPQPAPQAAPAAPGATQPQPQPVIPGEGVVVEAPMPGSILQVLVQVGDQVVENQGLVILEAMKMENEIVAPKSGTIGAVHVTNGSAIDVGKPIITIV